MTVKITPQTDAADSDTFSINSDNYGGTSSYRQGATFRVTGGVLGSGEYVKLQYTDGTNWIDAEVEGDEGKVLDADNSIRTIYGRMTNVRLSKSETVAARGVEVV
jgi:hypothetical protein